MEWGRVIIVPKIQEKRRFAGAAEMFPRSGSFCFWVASFLFRSPCFRSFLFFYFSYSPPPAPPFSFLNSFFVVFVFLKDGCCSVWMYAVFFFFFWWRVEWWAHSPHARASKGRGIVERREKEEAREERAGG